MTNLLQNLNRAQNKLCDAAGNYTKDDLPGTVPFIRLSGAAQNYAEAAQLASEQELTIHIAKACGWRPPNKLGRPLSTEKWHEEIVIYAFCVTILLGIITFIKFAG